jgi:hypothetical protein
MLTRWMNRFGLALVALAMALGNGCSSSLPAGNGGGGHAGNGEVGAGGGGGDHAGNGTAGTVGVGTGGTGVVGAGGVGGQENPGTDGGVPGCGMSIEQVCGGASAGSCDLTWSAVLADSSLCVASMAFSRNLVSDCGGYHVLNLFFLDGGSAFYYDGTTGALVAIVGIGINAGSPCVGGPAGGFVPPSGCATGTSPPQCTGDAGGD